MLRQATTRPYKQATNAFALCTKRFYAQDETGFHADFKTTQKKVAKDEVLNYKNQIDADVKSHSICLFMKGTPNAPECGFSRTVVQVLDTYGYQYHAVNVNKDVLLKEAVKSYSDWPTFPQVFVKGELVGGCDITLNLHREGELGKMLADSGANKKQ